MTDRDTTHRTAPSAGQQGDEGPTGDVPKSPTDLGRGSWMAAARRSAAEFKNDNLQDRAAALTYYGIQSIFPALLVLVSLLGLIGKSATQPLTSNLTTAAPSAVRNILHTAVLHLQSNGAAGVLAVVGIVLGLWSASGYVAAFMRASNAIYDVPEGRPVWKTYPLRLSVTLLVVVLLAASALIVVVTGGIARHVGQVIGASSALLTAWNYAKWPVLLILFSLMLSVLYWASPNAKRGFRWVSPGALLAIVVWIVASGLFALYVANFGHYNKVYGSIAAMIIFLIWMWISNLAILFGAEFNAELERGRAIAAGNPPDAEPFVEMRDTRKLRRRPRRRGARRTA